MVFWALFLLNFATILALSNNKRDVRLLNLGSVKIDNDMIVSCVCCRWQKICLIPNL